AAPWKNAGELSVAFDLNSVLDILRGDSFGSWEITLVRLKEGRGLGRQDTRPAKCECSHRTELLVSRLVV
ncbi:hypothetical protein X975_12298, partial [Stegodyphus mimosarum]